MLVIVTFNKKWVDVENFEKEVFVKKVSLASGLTEVLFVFKNNCYILVEALARLLALVNQLASSAIQIRMDFSEALNLHSYLSRNGFFKLLAYSVEVVPHLDNIHSVDIYRNNNTGLVEFCSIDPSKHDDDLPATLSNRFQVHVDSHYQAAFTFVAELYNNVIEHSKSKIFGFIGMQSYQGTRPHIQTVISDSGEGILGTIKPLLPTKYPTLASLTDEDLLIKMLNEGNISSNPDEGRGQGFKASSGIARKYNAIVNVRQSDIEIMLVYEQGQLVRTNAKTDLIPLAGSHICFDFFIDSI